LRGFEKERQDVEKQPEVEQLRRAGQEVQVANNAGSECGEPQMETIGNNTLFFDVVAGDGGSENSEPLHQEARIVASVFDPLVI